MSSYKDIIPVKYCINEVASSTFRKMIMLSFIIFFGLNLYSQTYTISAYDGQTVSTCNGVFYDSGGPADYGNDEDFTVTFCSDIVDKLLKIDFIMFNVRFNDTLFII